jgi:Recombination endonuclease VII
MTEEQLERKRAKDRRYSAKIRASMTEEQLEQQRVRNRRYSAKSRANMTEEQRERRRVMDGAWRRRVLAENPEAVRAKRRETSRRWRAANPEAARACEKRYKEAHPERYRANRKASSLRRNHGKFFAEDFAAMWEAQEGRCYLCENELAPGPTTHTDHDHTCCPPGRSCRNCRRGLACHLCNHLLGMARDDPELLLRIAANLAPVLAATRERIAKASAA